MGQSVDFQALLDAPYDRDKLIAALPWIEGTMYDDMIKLSRTVLPGATLRRAYGWALSRIGPHPIAEFEMDYSPPDVYGDAERVDEAWRLQQEHHPELQPGYIAPIPSTEPTPGDVTQPEVISMPTGPGPATIVDHYETVGSSVGPSQAPEIPWIWLAVGAVGLLVLAK